MSDAIRISAKIPGTKRENKTSQPQKPEFSQSINSPINQILLLQRTIGNQAVGRLIKSGALQAKLRIGGPDDVYEQEADRVADAVILNQKQDMQVFTVRRTTSSPIVQRNGMAIAYIRQLQAKQQYDDFIRNAEKYGLPVKFMKRVGRDCSITIGSSSYYNYMTNYLSLDEGDLASAGKLSPQLPIGEASAIRTIYEEGTHAYLDLAENEKTIKSFIEAGEKHYEGALTTKGEKTTSPSRVFQEAAGTYVGHRVASWWSAFEMLTIGVSSGITKKEFYEDIKRSYDNAMAELVFGYSEEGGVLGIGSKQVETTRPISAEMKKFLDAELLEGKIPDRFEQNPGFLNLLSQAMTNTIPGTESDNKREKKIMPKSLDGDVKLVPQGFTSYLSSLGGGQPLPTPARSFMESRFGFDFSKVRIHTDAKAAEAAQIVNARAFTVGNDIIFAAEQYHPLVQEGKRLLAHELMHVVHQADSSFIIQRKEETPLGVKLPDINSTEAFKPKYKYPWQNPHLRATIYPYREKELREFLLTYKELDLWNTITEVSIGPEITAEIGAERTRLEMQISGVEAEKRETEQLLKEHQRALKMLLVQPEIKELRRTKERLEGNIKKLQGAIKKIISEIDWYKKKAPEHPYREKKEKELSELSIKLDAEMISLEELTRAYEEKVAPYQKEEQSLTQESRTLKEEYKRLKSELETIPKVSGKKKVSRGDAVRWELRKYERELEGLDHDTLLERVLERFDSDPNFTRYSKWLRYMVIHFSGMRYWRTETGGSAHGSWASPQDLLKTLKRAEITEDIRMASGEAIAENVAQELAGLETELQEATNESGKKKIEAQIKALKAPEEAYEKIFASKPKMRELYEELKKQEQERDSLKHKLEDPDAMTKDVPEKIEALDKKIEALETLIGDKELKKIRKRMDDVDRERREALLKYRIQRAVERIGQLSDPRALGILKVMHDQNQFPDWVWKEIVAHTDLRLEFASADWETLTEQESIEKKKDDPVMERWRKIIAEWQNKYSTEWREKHRIDLSLITTASVCDQIGEQSQQARGRDPLGGLTLNVKTYLQEISRAPGTAYFKHLESATDLKPGASIFWLNWVAEKPENANIARPLPGVEFQTERGKPISDNYFDLAEGWTYHIDEIKKEITRTTLGICPEEPTSSDTHDVIIQWLRWQHEATVVEVVDMGGKQVVLTFESGSVKWKRGAGLKRLSLPKLLETKANIFVGFAPEGTAPSTLDEMLKDVLPGK